MGAEAVNETLSALAIARINCENALESKLALDICIRRERNRIFANANPPANRKSAKSAASSPPTSREPVDRRGDTPPAHRRRCLKGYPEGSRDRLERREYGENVRHARREAGGNGGPGMTGDGARPQSGILAHGENLPTKSTA